MFVLVLILMIACIGIPAGYAWRVFRLDEATRAGWLLIAAEAAVLVALILLLGRWDMAGHYTRFVLIVLFLGAVLWSWRRHASRPWGPMRTVLKKRWPNLVSLALFGAALLFAISGTAMPAGSRDLVFPLQGGQFMIAHGGGNALLNRHAGHREQRYAADITAINALGFRANSLLPSDLEQYAIFGASVVSPCGGRIVEARDDLPDLIPPRSDRDHPAGNHIVIDCGGFHVELAHLQRGSVRVTAGQAVAAGAVLGTAGNSGNTSEPHLHVHAVDPARRAGLPVTFGGTTPFRNQLYER